MGLVKRKWFWGPIAFIFVVAVVFSFFNTGDDTTTLAFSEVVAAGQDGRLERIEVTGPNLDISLSGDAEAYESRVARDTDVTQVLLAAGVPVGGADGVVVEFQRPNTYANLIGICIAWMPIFLFPFVIYFAVKIGVRNAFREDRERKV